MDIDEFVDVLRHRYLGQHVGKEESGAATWINVLAADGSGFNVEVVPGKGVGVSARVPHEYDPSVSHDRGFDTLPEALEYIESRFLPRESP